MKPKPLNQSASKADGWDVPVAQPEAGQQHPYQGIRFKFGCRRWHMFQAQQDKEQVSAKSGRKDSFIRRGASEAAEGNALAAGWLELLACPCGGGRCWQLFVSLPACSLVPLLRLRLETSGLTHSSLYRQQA